MILSHYKKVSKMYYCPLKKKKYVIYLSMVSFKNVLRKTDFSFKVVHYRYLEG